MERSLIPLKLWPAIRTLLFKNVSLVDSAGTVVSTINVPTTTAATWFTAPRFSTSFTPTQGSSDYRVSLGGTISGQQLWVSDLKTSSSAVADMDERKSMRKRFRKIFRIKMVP